jgi:hypothetical protein
MGYFANLYIVETLADKDSVTIETSIYGGEIEPKAYFSWGPGHRSENLYSYAHETIFSDSKLNLLPGYPMREQVGDPDRFLLEAQFTPLNKDYPVLYHFILPEDFVPLRNATIIQPTNPSVYIHT